MRENSQKSKQITEKNSTAVLDSMIGVVDETKITDVVEMNR